MLIFTVFVFCFSGSSPLDATATLLSACWVWIQNEILFPAYSSAAYISTLITGRKRKRNGPQNMDHQAAPYLFLARTVKGPVFFLWEWARDPQNWSCGINELIYSLCAVEMCPHHKPKANRHEPLHGEGKGTIKKLHFATHSQHPEEQILNNRLP